MLMLMLHCRVTIDILNRQLKGLLVAF